MKYKITVVLTCFIIFNSKMVVWAQEPAPAVVSFPIPIVCSYNCDNSFDNLRENCPIPGNLSVRSYPLSSTNINPYQEFDGIIRLLRGDPLNPFSLSYTFSPCATVCNAASCTFPGPIDVIFYNQQYLDGIRGGDRKAKWAIRSIIAHEIGHHILGHTSLLDVPSDVRRRNERRADFFAGFVIQKFEGATLDDAFEGLNSIDVINYSPQNDQEEIRSIYPTLEHRRIATKEGFLAKLNDQVTLDMFVNIQLVAEELALKNGGSSIFFRKLNKEIAANNLIDAEKLIADYLAKDIFEKDLLFESQSIIFELAKKNTEAVASQRKSVQLKPDDVGHLTRLKELLEKGNTRQKKEAMEIQNKINSFRSND